MGDEDDDDHEQRGFDDSHDQGTAIDDNIRYSGGRARRKWLYTLFTWI